MVACLTFLRMTWIHSTTAAPELSMQFSIVWTVIQHHFHFAADARLTFSWIIVAAWLCIAHPVRMVVGSRPSKQARR